MSAPAAKARLFAELDAARREDSLPPPRVLVLVGIPGSGKSTFADHLRRAGWARVSQDELGSRARCEAAAARLLRDGRNVVVDRCNFDRAQRKHWTDLAGARGSACGAVVFGTPLDACVRRVRARTGHPTLDGGQQGEDVVKFMAEQFTFPDRAERFSFCRVIRGDADAERVLTEILSAP